MTMTTLEHERARFAWEKVAHSKETRKKDFVQLAKAAPTLVMGNGLMATLAYYAGKSDLSKKTFLPIIQEWLARRFHVEVGKSYEATMKWLVEADAQTYLEATNETLELLRWVKQFASALEEKE
jgi:CRISPR-associated protein Cmr5